MNNLVESFMTVSRAEFLLPNLGSLIMGLAWGVTSSTTLSALVMSILFSFVIINLSSAIGAQANSLSDIELDSKDKRKRKLFEAMKFFQASRLRKVLVGEFFLTLALVSVFMLIPQKPVLLLLWVIGISIGCVYSLPPFRLKSRKWLAPVSLMLALAFLPVMFAYYSFTVELNPLFIMSLVGLALTVYGVIMPTEIGDYFRDKATGIETFTVSLGLVQASTLAIALLATGATLTFLAFLFEFMYSVHPYVSIALVAIPISIIFVLRQFQRLHFLSKKYAAEGTVLLEDEIVDLSARNRQWIMIITQTYTAISIILLLSKFLP
jgi:4-hydroxybenzoate polyprenyltransferase